MKKLRIILLLFINSYSLFAQTVLTYEGMVTVSDVTGIWNGVDVPRNQPTIFTYKNSSITSVNFDGYLLQAGDESVGGANNNLDGEVITGNKFIWNGTDGTSITHGAFTGYNLNVLLTYNYLLRVPMGLIRKSNGMTNTSGGVAYNIVNNSQAVGVVVKGICGVNIYNNTIYSDQVIYNNSSRLGTWRGLIDVYTNTDITPNGKATGTKIKNNIFYTKHQIYNIYVYDAACLTGFESDYNVFYCEAGTPLFNYLGTIKTFAEWQALGYDKHSVVVNPNFRNFTDFVPLERLDYGTDLGTTWQKGLAVDAIWGSGDPATTNQNGTWQAGARIYSSDRVPVTGITVTGAGGANSVTTDNGTLQLSATVLPSYATDKTVTWSVVNGTGQASISSSGRVTAIDNGNVTAIATANDGSGVYGSLNITISNQIVPVTSVNVTGEGGATIIDVDNGTLQVSATAFPANATNKSVTWSIVNGTALASISTNGLVTALDNGTVTVRATANDGSGISGSFVITILHQIIPVTGIIVSGTGGSNLITTDGGSLQLTATVVPANATDKTILWTIANGTGQASINSTGLVSAVENGTVTAIASASDGSGINGTFLINISNQTTSVTGITVSGTAGSTAINTDNGSLQLIAEVLPANATNKNVTWSISNGAGLASVNSSGLVTAADNGNITVRATANDGSGVYGTLVITVSNQIVPVTGITITGAGGQTVITSGYGSLQLNAAVFPVNATNKTLIWSITGGAMLASISTSGLLTAADNGVVTVMAAASDGSGVFGTIDITITNQVIPVTDITVSGAGGLNTISTDNGTLQLNAAILPVNATHKAVAWTVANGTGQASVNPSGLLTAIVNGTVTAVATATDGSGVYGSVLITLSNQIIPVTGISITGAGGSVIITTDNGTLQLTAAVMPANATDNTVSWFETDGTGQANVNSAGLVTAISNGNVTITAIANDGSGIIGTLVVTINSGLIAVSGLTVAGAGGSNFINTNQGSLQLTETVLPSDATNKTVTWSVLNGTGQATISTTGLVTAIDNGIVIAKATANDGSGIFGTLTITISNQVVSVNSITVSGSSGSSIISDDNGSLQLSALVLPAASTDNSVTWSVTNGTGQASISAAGLVTAIDNGTVTARATANDGSGVFGILVITISNQIIPLSSITVTGTNNATAISTDNGSLQLTATVMPVNATDKTVTWSIVNGSQYAVISNTGLVTAAGNGIITLRATANDGSGVYGSIIITISNQIIPVSGITITGAGGKTTISADNGSLQLSASVLPGSATDKSVTWSLVNGNSIASISTTGLVTALDNGNITVRATANDGSGVYGTLVISISRQVVPVSSITIKGAGGLNTIASDNGTLQLTATILPANASNKTVTWSLVAGTGQATINSTGRVRAYDNGTITAIATANDGSGVIGSLLITISNQLVPVTGITVTGADGSAAISINKGTLQLSVSVVPVNATNKTVTWTLTNSTGKAGISSTGLVTAIDNGTVTARATANDGSGIYGTYVISISNQIVPVTNISVTGAGGATIITSDNGTLQLNAVVQPANATNKSVTWTLINGSGQASISAAGLVSAIDNGTVTATATANDGSGVSAVLTITIFNQFKPVTAISISGAGGSSGISTDNGTLQLSALVSPANATDKSVSWTLVNGTGLGIISADGLVTAINNGTVTARATANDGSGVSGTMILTISNQFGPVTSINISGAGGATSITTDNGTLQLTAAVLPVNAPIKTVTWSFVNDAGLAAINAAGLLTAVDNGSVTVKATANDGSGVYGTIVISITNQIVPVTDIMVAGKGSSNSITENKGVLQLTASVLPVTATDKTVSWSIVNVTGIATINAAGLITAVNNGSITAIATANDGSGVYGTIDITISNQIVALTSIAVTAAGGAASITTDGGSLQLIASVLPTYATSKEVTWSITGGSGQAVINSDGVVTAVSDGTVTAVATANDGSGVFGTLDILISGQLVPVTGIVVKGLNGSTAITSRNLTLQLVASVLPVNATNKTVTWSISRGTELASIDETGLVMPTDNGIVTVMAEANDGSGVRTTLDIPIIDFNSDLFSIIVTRDNIRLQLNDNYISWKAGIYNFQGGIVMSKQIDSNTIDFEVSNLSSGIYLIVLSKGENIRVSKVFKP
jgi:uncharacterized protein YjdB